VHISEKTLSYLNGEFEVEPALGEKREETLRMAGIKTFFIVKALKPVSATCTVLIQRGHTISNNTLAARNLAQLTARTHHLSHNRYLCKPGRFKELQTCS